MIIKRSITYAAATILLLAGCKSKIQPTREEFSKRIQATREDFVANQRLLLLDSAITAYPDEALFYFERGICKAHLSNDTGEIADLSRAINLSEGKDCETYYSALSVRGLRWMHQGKHQAAFDDFWAATTLGEKCQPDADYLDVYLWNAGLVARHALKFDLTDSVIQHWVLVDSGSIELKKLRAETYRLRMMPNEALMAYNTVLLDSHERKDDILWIGRAKVHKALQDNQKAWNDLDVAKSLVDGYILRTKDSISFSHTLAEILYARNENQAAIKICDRFLQDGDPLHRSKLLCTRGEAMQAMGNTDQACADWEKSAALGWGEAQRNLEKYCNR